jgi:hypothetical protein
LRTSLEEDLRQELAGSKGKSSLNLYKFAKNFIDKEVEKHLEQFKGLIHRSDKYYLCNGYMALEFAEKIDQINIINNQMALDVLFKDAKRDATDQFMDIDSLKFECAKAKTQKGAPVIFEFNCRRYGFNPNDILNSLKVIKTPKVYLSDNNTVPMYITGENANALILAVRIKDEQ